MTGRVEVKSGGVRTARLLASGGQGAWGFKSEGKDNRDCGKGAAYTTNPPHGVHLPRRFDPRWFPLKRQLEPGVSKPRSGIPEGRSQG